ncbi:MAG: transglutaminase family protein [Gammaproteobacteria bacterium]|nr:transglutaminase family protein [Gammaproteobacteria bacterium]
MTIRVKLLHVTEYRFDRLVNLSPHVLRLRPAAHCRTPIRGYSLRVSPATHFLNWQQDPCGNYLARLVFPERSDHLSITVEVIAEMTVINPFDFFLDEGAEQFPFDYGARDRHELAPYLVCEPAGPLLRRWLASVARAPIPTNDFLVALNQRLQRDIAYNVRMEPGVQSCEQTLELARGSCRDSAWLLVQICRHLGLAARFVSGYLVQLKADVAALDGPSGPTADFTDLHAWCEVYLPGAGWVGLDPTSGLFAGEGHIPLACTPDPVSAAPIEGFTDECEVEFRHHNEVLRIHEDPRVTKPYSDTQWALIDAMGAAVDARLDAMDVRLTQGGEPTFVSIDDMESPQWNTTALGADKLRLARDLLLRLRDRFARGGLLHHGQGKWYPGEELPRWALGCFWRGDGEPVWRDPQWLAPVGADQGHDFAAADRFAHHLCVALALDPARLLIAHEDAFHYLWREQELPEHLDPQTAALDDSLERRRLARLLQQGLHAPTGLVLPLGRDPVAARWRSSPWPLRRGQLILIPGDSPMGYRLPLDSLPPATEAEAREAERDPFAPDKPLDADYHQYAQAVLDAAADRREIMAEPADPEADADRPASLVRTALCIEPRAGTLHIFLPPLQHLEHYLTLVGAVEACAADLRLPVVIEGYEPPRDPRLLRLLVTPDPGVIEVNIHPASNWQELRDNTLALYAEAHQARLGTEKFLHDGRHTGTGGGNHVTLGGATPADSPLLRRPDLLRSLITYWQHHPGLSYAFSGMFIGPTSQSPRVDEGRAETLYELEIAFQQMPSGEIAQPWLVDRLLRNLLTDITGNTHRSEFCIDKLYAPGSASGRQGILEFRGFEMPPHAHMALVQALLLRSLVARLWRTPYRQPLVRWGTALHDRFLLPHYAWQDLRDVVADLNAHELPFQLDWLAPFAEFRYPHYGEVRIGDIRIELRWAIEPWHVLGEEVGSFGTARYVDSSVERIQVKVDGLTDSRYVLACNGRRVPLRNTGRHGEYVAGVRYRAWAPPSALHPTIGVQAPLVFDLIDTWNGMAVGGCTYHVVHPGGRSYDDFPVNANAAEARRVSRFTAFGHTPGKLAAATLPPVLRQFVARDQLPRPMAPPPEEPSDEYPHTLDLRRGA